MDDIGTVTVDEWAGGTAGWRCRADRGGCGRYAGPYGSVTTANINAEVHRGKCAKVERR